MTVASRISLVLVVAMGVSGVGFVGAVLAQNPHAAPPIASQLKAPAEAQVKTDSQNMMAAMQADQKRIDDLVAAMNVAAPADKLDRLAAVVTELAAQHKRMGAGMMSMHSGMMKMMMSDEKAPPDAKTPEADHQLHHP